MYLGTKMVDLVRGEGNRSMWGLWGKKSGMVSWGDGGCGEGHGNLWDIGKGAVYDEGVSVCQLTTGVACKEDVGGQ